MIRPSPTIHMFCGKIASGKSTLADNLARGSGTVLIAKDKWLHALFADMLQAPSDYVEYASRLRRVIAPHVIKLLGSGLSVVLDFPANTVAQRDWLRGILGQTDAAHQFHFIDVSDALCLTRLHARNHRGDHPFVVYETQFRQFTRHFVEPSLEEGVLLVKYSEGA
ncbi:ATP-binding protein [Sinirhodobacter sp. WL0062]|uniref:ATP-binding protein n=1 Tax=Rhodobacter flavimaris TaxID=2907145 RepID=A0ABS8YYP8_9RHOB|nr:ATP-binding protein [Sinirhodobacter sp. WL0062]MCE5974919.1 ATP-binding protein [Sinirhodobacter sp. WL0062]